MLDFLVGLAVSVLSGLGIGGGGLLVIWLVLYHSAEQLDAQGINLVFFLFSSTAAMVVHLIKRTLNFRLIVYLSLVGGLGALLGSMLAKSISPELIRSAFGILLILSGVLTLVKRQK